MLRPGSRRRGRTLAQELVEEFADKIRAGGYRPGDKLPTEPELVAQFEVSRTVVREAISRLQAVGLAETRHGVGTFVLPRPAALASPPDERTVVTIKDVLAMLELRISIESEAAALAATRRSKGQLAAIQRAVTHLDEAVASRSDAARADFEFHLEIALATGNRYFEEILQHLGLAAIPRTRLDTARLSSEPLHVYLKKTNLEHSAIFEAIARKDPDAARAAMRLHLANSMERLRRASVPESERKRPGR